MIDRPVAVSDILTPLGCQSGVRLTALIFMDGPILTLIQISMFCDYSAKLRLGRVKGAWQQISNRKFRPMPDISPAAGLAALAICESLLLALNDRKILPEKEIVGILSDAAAAHENAMLDEIPAELHREVADMIHKIIDGGNSVRRR